MSTTTTQPATTTTTTTTTTATTQKTNQHPRLVHKSATLSKCLVTQQLKYPPIPSPDANADEANTPQSPSEDWVWTDLDHRRPIIPSEYCQRIHKMVNNASSKTLETRYDDYNQFIYRGAPANVEEAPNKDDLVQLLIPNTQYASNILKLADEFGSSEVIPALCSKMAQSRSRFSNNGFLAELNRIPLSLYSRAYLEQSGSSFINVMENRKVQYDTNDPIHLGTSVKIHDQRLKNVTHIGHGDVTNASDILITPLFQQQFITPKGTIPSHDDYVALEQFMQLPARIKNQQFTIPFTSYIGTHSPPEHVQDIFYQMLFEQRVRMVVALTLAEAYWPISGPASRKEEDPRYILGQTEVGTAQRFGNFMVKIIQVEEFSSSDVVIARHVKIVHDPIHEHIGANPKKTLDWDTDVNDQNSIDCVLLQYLSWPDMGVPEIESFASFYQIYTNLKARLEAEHSHSPLYLTRPIAGHCLAGIGRKGTFTAIDIIITYLATVFGALGVELLPGSSTPVATNMPKVTSDEFRTLMNEKFTLAIVPVVILGLRSCRRGMVQTVEQVRFIARFVSMYINTLVNRYMNQD